MNTFSVRQMKFVFPKTSDFLVWYKNTIFSQKYENIYIQESEYVKITNSYSMKKVVKLIE